MSLRKHSARERLYAQLVCSLYDTLVPMIIMSAGFVLSFCVMAYEAADPVLAIFAGLGALSNGWRIFVVITGRTEAKPDSLGIKRARLLERRFAIAYYQFAVLLGAASAYALIAALPHSQMLIVCLLVGYGAGAAVGVGLRPWIAVPSMIIAIVPAIIAAAIRPELINWLTSAMMAALLAGGISSLLARYRIASMQIAERFTFETLARQDNLTALPNRLALREWYNRNIALANERQFVAVHCLDLDKFKPVNDVYGHPIGDGLLRAVADRLSRVLRPGDIAARLGGDEFAVIQRNVSSADEAVALALRLRESIAEPFSIRGHAIDVSVCIGVTVARHATPDLEEVLGLADQALYRAKKSGTGLEYNEWSVEPAIRLAS